MTLVWIFVAGLIVVSVLSVRTSYEIACLRKRGMYPAKGEARIEDVERLLRSDYSTWAIRCYREINNVSLRDAKAAVDSMRV